MGALSSPQSDHGTALDSQVVTAEMKSLDLPLVELQNVRMRSKASPWSAPLKLFLRALLVFLLAFGVLVLGGRLLKGGTGLGPGQPGPSRLNAATPAGIPPIPDTKQDLDGRRHADDARSDEALVGNEPTGVARTARSQTDLGRPGPASPNSLARQHQEDDFAPSDSRGSDSPASAHRDTDPSAVEPSAVDRNAVDPNAVEPSAVDARNATRLEGSGRITTPPSPNSGARPSPARRFLPSIETTNTDHGATSDH